MTKRDQIIGYSVIASLVIGVSLFVIYNPPPKSTDIPAPPAVTSPTANSNVIPPADALMHDLVIWVVTQQTQVPDVDKADVYNPSKPKDDKAPPPKTHMETRRIAYAKEFKTKPEADAFINAAPAEMKKHMHLIDEDQ